MADMNIVDLDEVDEDVPDTAEMPVDEPVKQASEDAEEAPLALLDR